MNTTTNLRIVLCAMSAVVAPQPLVSAQGSSAGNAEQIVRPDASAGRWAKDLFQTYSTEGDDALRHFVTGSYLTVCLRIGPAADFPCFGLVWRMRNLIICKDREEVMR